MAHARSSILSPRALCRCCIAAVGVCAPHAHAQFVDDCASAPIVAEGTFAFDLTVASGGETPFTVPCASERLALIDQWVRYVPSATGPVEISTVGLSAGDTVVSVHDTFDPEFDCAFAPFQVRACNDDFEGAQSRVVFIATAGEAILVRVAGALESRPTGSVSISPFTPLAGDSCDNPLPASDGVNAYDTSLAVINDFVGCQGLRDVYYAYTPTQTGGLTVSTCGQPTQGNIAIFAGCGGNTLACNPFGTCNAVTAVEAGIPIIIRISNDESTGPEAFTITVDPNALPINDSCFAPSVVSLGDTPFDNSFASTSVSLGCSSDPFSFASGLDLWYTFTPSVTGTYDFATDLSPGLSDTQLALYAGCFDGPFACNDDARGFLSFIRTPLVAGQPVIIRVSGAGLPGSGTPIDRGAGVLTVRQSIAPANDECDFATSVTAGLTPFDLYDATSGLQFPSCQIDGIRSDNDIWFRYVPTQSGPVEASLTSTDAPMDISLFRDCEDLGAIQTGGLYYDPADGSDTPRLVVDGIPGQPLLFRVAFATLENDALPAAGAGQIYVGPPLPATPPNDACQDAAPITYGTTAIDLTGSVKDCVAAASPNFDASAGVTDNDIFYRFTPEETGTVQITIDDGVSYPNFDGLVVSVYDACGAAPIAGSFTLGDAPADAIFFDGVQGVEYIVRVGSILRFGSLNIQSGTITIGDAPPECPPCAADYDNNGGVDGGDLAAFFTDFETGEACADVDQNGGVDGGDLGFFFTVFEQGGC